MDDEEGKFSRSGRPPSEVSVKEVILIFVDRPKGSSFITVDWFPSVVFGLDCFLRMTTVFSVAFSRSTAGHPRIGIESGTTAMLLDDGRVLALAKPYMG